MCPRNIAHEPRRDARVNFGIHILTKTEVYSHFQQSRKKHQSNTKVSPHFFFLGGPQKGGPYTHQNLNFCPNPLPGHFLYIHSKKPKNVPLLSGPPNGGKRAGREMPRGRSR